MDRHGLVQRYVERQKAYLPTYTAEGLVNECRGAKSRSDAEFGFDTPVLRPRAPAALQAGPSSPLRTRKAKEAPATRDPTVGNRDKPKSRRKKASTPPNGDTDSDNDDEERAARLAGRRERKRKRRAVVDPPQRNDVDEITPAAAPKKGRTKKPAALALLYGFSAANVTKDRLTLKPAPSLGVFNKGKASAKKKVATVKKSSPRNGLFSESAFLNKPNERVDSDRNHPVAPEIHTTDCTKGDRVKCNTTSRTAIRTIAESDVWDIEMQSKLPSSVRDVSSEPESAPVVVDLRRAEWSASIDEEYETRQNETQTTRLSITRRQSRGRSEIRDSHATDTSSLHPSHSASQVGRRADDSKGMMIRKHSTEQKPACTWGLGTNAPETTRENEEIELNGCQNQDVVDTGLDLETVCRMASPMSTSVPLDMAQFRTRYDMDVQEALSESWLQEDCWDVARGGFDRGNIKSTNGSLNVEGYDYACQDETLDWRDCGGLTADEVELDGNYDALEGYEDAIEMGETWNFEGECEYGVEEGDYMSICEDMKWNVSYGEEGRGDFLEGRALLLGVNERARHEGMSGLVEAELDVASRVRGHWWRAVRH